MPEGFDWRQLLSLAPLAVAGFKGGGPAMGSFGEGYSRGRAVLDEMSLRQRSQAAREAAEQYAQSRDLVGDQRYEQERQDEQSRREQAEIWQALQQLPVIRESVIDEALQVGAPDPEDYVKKRTAEMIDLLGNVLPTFKKNRDVILRSMGDIRGHVSTRMFNLVKDDYEALTRDQDERSLEALRSNPAPVGRRSKMPFSEMERIYWGGAQPPAQVSKLTAKQRYEQALERGDQVEAAKWLQVIKDESEATRVTVDTGGSGGTWTDTGRVNDKGDAIYVNNKTLETKAMPYGKKPTQTGTTSLSPSLQDDIATMKTVEDLIDQVTTLGDKTGWSGVGGFAQGSIGEFKSKNLGTGTPESVTLRGYIGQIKGTIAKLRGGTSFTPNEQKLLDTYTPGINESPMSIKAKMNGLREFIRMKRKNQLETALGPGAPVPSHQSATGGGLITITDGKGNFYQAPAGTPIPAGYAKVGG